MKKYLVIDVNCFRTFKQDTFSIKVYFYVEIVIILMGLSPSSLSRNLCLKSPHFPNGVRTLS